jgi:hypothetical protein
MRTLSMMTLAVWLSSTIPAVAQPGPPPAPLAPQPQPPPIDAQALYDAAFAALLLNDLVNARAGFEAAQASAADPELRGAAREMLRLTDEVSRRQGRLVFGPGPGPGEPNPLPPGNDRDDPDEGRTGIIVSTTLASIYAGAVFADLADTGDARAITGIVTATTGLGFVLSLYGTRDRTNHGGTAEAYSLGMMIGAGNGLLLASPLGADTSEQWNTAILGGMALTAGAGFLYGQSVRPTRGQVSFAGTMATMGLVTTGLGLLVVLPDMDADSVLLTMAAGLDAGAAGGLYLGRNLTWSNGRGRLVWLSALLGGLGGVATSTLLFGGGDGDGDDDGEIRTSAAIVLAGAWGGLLLGIHATRNMRPDARYRVATGDDRVLTPIALPGGAGLGYAGRF